MALFFGLGRRARAAALLAAALLLASCRWGGELAESGSEPDTAPPATATLDAQALRAFGAEPGRGDTDGDGLNDAFEILQGWPVLRPDRADSDGNGTPDGDEDADGDGLTHREEQAAGTHPFIADTDGDGLSDGDELRLTRSSPLQADTDGDGIADGRERAIGSDPLRADAQATFTSSATHTTYARSGTGGWGAWKVQLELRGTGDLAGQARVRPFADAIVPGQVSPRFDISLQRPGAVFERATLTLPYDAQHPDAADPAQLAVVTVDPATGLWQVLPSTVDTQRHTVSADTPHFSPFFVAHAAKLQQAMQALPRTCTNTQRVDLALVIDSSGSMLTNDPSFLRVAGARRLVDALKPGDRGLVVDFDDVAVLQQGLTDDKAALSDALGRIDAAGGTDIGAGIDVALNEFDARGSGAPRVMVLLTDGDGFYTPSTVARLMTHGTRLFTVGLGRFIDEAFLRRMAALTGGTYQHASTADALAAVFTRQKTLLVDDGTDSDGDGLTDCQEVQGIYLVALGAVVTTDPFNPDTDGDGAPDGVETAIPRAADAAGGPLWVADGHSNPSVADTDDDGLSDTDEYRLALNPLARDTDGDGLADGDEVGARGFGPGTQTDPTSVDTDGDGLSDYDEVRDAGRQGLDPLVRDWRGWAFHREFMRGLLLGDLTDIDTVPALVGQMASGLVPIADLRDAIANVAKGDWVGAGFSLVALVPAAGDTARAGARAVGFAEKYPQAYYEVIRYSERVLPSSLVARILPLPPKLGAWLLSPLQRGRVLEAKIAPTIPGTPLLGNYPSFDVFDFATGKATSIKSLDLDAKTYRDIAAFERRVERCITQMKGFKGAPRGTTASGVDYRELGPQDVLSRELVFAFPREPSAAQRALLQRLAQSSQVTITFRVLT
jgi:von Willebrand factor type A domain/Bacterial TSP3 repeat